LLPKLQVGQGIPRHAENLIDRPSPNKFNETEDGCQTLSEKSQKLIKELHVDSFPQKAHATQE
jgi:hypothetical protein